VSSSSEPSYSIVVPTYNRPHLLRLLLHYMHLAGARCPIVVADGSDGDGLAGNRALIRHYAERGLRLRHYVPDTTMTFGQRILAGAELIDTPFAKISADDDAASVEFMDEAVARLAADLGCSAVAGYTASIQVGGDAAARSIVSVERPPPPPERLEPKAMQRLLRHALGFPLIYSMQRRETLLTVARGIAETEQADREARGSHDFGLSAVYAFEALLDHFLLAAGRVRVIDRMMIGRLYHAENYGKRIGRWDIVDVFLRPDWRPTLAPYFRLVCEQVVRSDGISPEQAEHVVGTALIGRFEPRLRHTLATRRERLWPELAQAPVESGLRARLRRVELLRTAVLAMRRLRSEKRREAAQVSPEISLLCRAVVEANREPIG